MEYASRDEIDPKYRWDLTDIFATDEDFLAALDDAQGLPARYAAFRQTATQSATGLLEFLRFDEETDVLLGRLGNWAERKSDEDTRNATYQGYASQVMMLYTQIAGAASWFDADLLALPAGTVDGYLAAEPELERYRRALDRILRMREHVLSPAEERLLAAAGDMAGQAANTYSLLNDADLRFPDATDAQGERHAVTHGSFVPLLMSHDRTLRESAYQSVYDVYGQFKDTCAGLLAGQVKQLAFFAKSRKYDSALAYCLDANEVPVEVYTNLIDAVHANLPALHRYVDLRRDVMGMDKLRFFDLYVPLVKDVDMRFTYEEACEMVLAALAPMGEDYLALVRKGLSERWVDVYETPGKRSGGYSAGGYGMHPVILLNFQGTLDDVFTLVHEMGHSIHTYLSCANQPAVYSSYVIFVAEVASTCNEALLTRYLLDHETDPARRAYVLNHFLEQFRATLYRQCMFAEFELAANQLEEQGKAITAEALCDIYRGLNERYFGSGVVVDDQIACEWARIPHFYYQYYVYQYATGFAAAIALSDRILSQGAPAVEDYLGFLKGGCSKPPLDLLRGAGVDMATPEPVNAALRRFDSLIDELRDAL